MWELDYPESEHSTRLLLGDPTAEAYEWLKAYAKSLSGEWRGSYMTITPEELISTAMKNIEGNDWGEYIERGGLLEGMRVESMFWDKLSVLKGIEIPIDKRNSFFSCSY